MIASARRLSRSFQPLPQARCSERTLDQNVSSIHDGYRNELVRAKVPPDAFLKLRQYNCSIHAICSTAVAIRAWRSRPFLLETPGSPSPGHTPRWVQAELGRARQRGNVDDKAVFVFSEPRRGRDAIISSM